MIPTAALALRRNHYATLSRLTSGYLFSQDQQRYVRILGRTLDLATVEKVTKEAAVRAGHDLQVYVIDQVKSFERFGSIIFDQLVKSYIDTRELLFTKACQLFESQITGAAGIDVYAANIRPERSQYAINLQQMGDIGAAQIGGKSHPFNLGIGGILRYN
jgi:hypothetical protein